MGVVWLVICSDSLDQVVALLLHCGVILHTGLLQLRSRWRARSAVAAAQTESVVLSTVTITPALSL